MRRLRFVLIVCVLLVGGGIACDDSTESSNPSTSDSSESAPAFTVETFTGVAFSLAEQRGTPVVLNFWESW